MQQSITVDIRIEEDESDTLVHAVLSLRGDNFEATGRARRNPTTSPCPWWRGVGRRRALSNLALQVMEAAQHKIERFPRQLRRASRSCGPTSSHAGRRR